MLIEFAVANYRSLRDEQRLTLVAGADKNLRKNNVFETSSGKKKPLRLLRSAALYGPNASGKTNLIKALAAMQRMVLNSTRMTTLPVEPFLFDTTACAQPTLFEVMVMVEGVRYQYGFTATAERIHDEWLFAFPKGRGQRWFEREFFPEDDRDEFTFGDKLTGDREVWRRVTRSDALFLSTAVQLNSKQLQPLFDWFRDTLRVVGLDSSISTLFDSIDGWSNLSIEWCRNGSKSRILKFLQAADLSISDLREETNGIDFDIGELLPELPSHIQQIAYHIKSVKGRVLMTAHRTADGQSIELPFPSESDGTQKMFHLAAPWLDTLNRGRVLFVDELHDNLHPWLVQFLVRFFHSNETNPRGAQLIFTTHETAILSDEYLRRDQIWFCERNRDQSSRLYSLADFKPRKGIENIDRSYLVGCYGALPFVLEPSEIAGS